MKYYINQLLFICIILLCNFIFAQQLPPITYYSPKDYNAENQNWGISQAKNKYIYIANNLGLLKFNGAQWQLHQTPNETIMRSVKVIDDKIYTGAYMDFGYWQNTKTETLEYTSLVSKLNIDVIEDEEFWNIKRLDNYIIFQSLDRIYILNSSDNSINTIDIKQPIIKMYTVDNDVYFQSKNGNLYKIKNGKAVLISDNDILNNKIIVNIFKQGNSLLIITQNHGFYTFQNGTISPFETAFNSEEKTSIYNAISLKNGNLVLGTIANGVIILSPNGEIIYHINQNEGLGNNTILSAFQDTENNLWLGLDNGIDVINLNSPFKIYNDANGKLGSVYASIIYENTLYLGTNQGLFYKPENSDNFEIIKGTEGQVWALKQIDNTLFCGHNSGTFVIQNNTANLIKDTFGTWDIKAIPNSNQLIQGHYNGLSILEKTDDTWQLAHNIEGFNISSRYFEFINTEQLLVNHEYKGIFKLNANSNFTRITNVTKDTISKSLHSSLLKYNNEVFYAFKNGIFKYNTATNDFVKDSVLSQSFTPSNYASGKLIAPNNSNTIWSFSNANISYLKPDNLNNTPKLNSINLSQDLRNTVTGFESVTAIDKDNFLIGTSNGYITLNLNKKNSDKNTICLNSIYNSIASSSSEPKRIDINKNSTFKNKQNNFTFNYNLANYSKFNQNQYQYQLSGFQDNWSSWSDKASTSFKYLPHGTYTFKVRGRSGNTPTTNEASYTFTIKRPWYISIVMLAIYVLGIILFSIFMHKMYKNYYKKKEEKLRQEQDQKLKLKALENKQELMRAKTETLELDVDSKNRELAISTMSLLKKNEFLSKVKNELSNIKEPTKEIKSVIKLINNNLNNTDDWKFFEEAFNNADKDFLKKIKQKHPNLTPNDLKLCAYLRLNLSSKEIAPLLNISPRSVEVKRYRLRKKMNLEHEVSLANYILEL